jgi:hypothetical protein
LGFFHYYACKKAQGVKTGRYAKRIAQYCCIAAMMFFIPTPDISSLALWAQLLAVPSLCILYACAFCGLCFFARILRKKDVAVAYGMFDFQKPKCR